jgi:hypothetical protein
MNDPARRQLESRCDSRVTGRAAAKPATVFLQARSGSAVNGTVDAAAAEQTAVRGIDNGIHGQGGDIGDQHLNHGSNSIMAQDMQVILWAH